ncbi:MAG: hypothetical protein HGGPFJEG_01628 [Ignavibacteria bacterium]|nr:hypothetical protein [Ignavibacteria bacterium]
MDLEFGRITILVNDYDEAFAFYEKTLSCKKFFDLIDNGQRFLHVGLNAKDKSGIWFLKAETDEQKKLVGNQTCGMPMMVLYTDSIDGFYEHLKNLEIKISKELTEKEDSRFFHFVDLYGNEIVMVEMKISIDTSN